MNVYPRTMREMVPAPNAPPITLRIGLRESPTPWMYLATCAIRPSRGNSFSCSSASRVSAATWPASPTKSL